MRYKKEAGSSQLPAVTCANQETCLFANVNSESASQAEIVLRSRAVVGQGSANVVHLGQADAIDLVDAEVDAAAGLNREGVGCGGGAGSSWEHAVEGMG